MTPRTRGAARLPDGSTRFAVWASRPSRVELRLPRDGRGGSHPMERGADGVHRLVVGDVPAGTDYSYRLDGGADRPDPVSRHLPQGVHGPSRVVDPAGFRWTDARWRGRELTDLVIYELHIGTFTPGGTFDAAIERLPGLAELGVTAIELMPVAEFPGRRNWGYDGVSLYAPESSYGGPEGLRRLVDAAHAAGVAVLLDVVYNHLGPEGNYLAEFGPYMSERCRTAWGQGFNLDGPGSDEVRRYLVDNATYWIEEYHLDGLRLDAADRILDPGPAHLAEQIGSAVHRAGEALGRRTLVIAEVHGSDPRWVRARGEGGLGLDAQWCDDFHHAVHVALTGERGGYYAPFDGVRAVARALQDGEPPGGRRVVCVQNHDQVGNRPTGDRLAALVDPAALRLAAAILLLSPCVPLLFMGEEHGETTPFLYFVSHGDPALLDAVREGRRREFAAFAWPVELPDPQAEATFEASRPRWGAAGGPAGAGLRSLYRRLLALRRIHPALRPGASVVRVRHDAAAEWVAVHLSRRGDELEAVYNFGSGERTVDVGRRGRPELVLATDAPAYGGGDGARVRPGAVTVPGRSAVLLRIAR